MAIMKCLNCDGEISSFSIECVHCGEKVSKINEIKKPKEKSLLLKIVHTINLWAFWPILSELIFGNGVFGILIQGIVQIVGTILVWRKPKIKVGN